MNGVYKIGDKVLNNWILVSQLGKGNCGTVFEAEREDFGITYKAAIKIISIPQSKSEITSLRSEGMTEEDISEYFMKFVHEIVQEVSIMARLKGNNNVVNYEDHEIVPHDQEIGWDIIIRMELLTPLKLKIKDEKLNRKEVIKLGIDLCNALTLCEENDIIHRDIKPENIFISENGNYKLGDFGFARTIDKTNGGMSKKGSYGYMAPEVYQDKAYGATVDIYSLGLVLYSLANNNRLPFLPDYPNEIRYSDRVESLTRRMNGEPFPVPCDNDSALMAVILKACSYDPEDRFETASAMKKELVKVITKKEKSGVPESEPDFAFNNITAKQVRTKKNQSEEKTGLTKKDNIRIPSGITFDATVSSSENEENFPEDKTISMLDARKNSARKIRKNRKRRKKLLFSLLTAGVVLTGIGLFLYFNIPNINKYNDAKSLFSAGDFEQARAYFSEIIDYKDSRLFIEKCDEGIVTSKYQKAISLFKSGELTEAQSIFEELNDYEDSEEMLRTIRLETIYSEGLSYYEEKNFSSALTCFEQLGEYRDSTGYIEKCKAGAQNQDYENAVHLFETGKYAEAANIFKLSPDLYDSSDYLELCNMLVKICAAEEGQVVSFGRYEQDNNSENGRDKIEWRILKKQNDSILLISKYCLECAVFNESENTNWANSSIREWLNNEFFNEAFSDLENSVILSTEIDNQNISTHAVDNGANTVDQVYLLTVQDAKTYFTTDLDRAAAPTAHALSNGIKAVNGRSSWWLRSMGSSNSVAAYTFLNGKIGEDGDIVNSRNMGVRPVIRIRISS